VGIADNTWPALLDLFKRRTKVYYVREKIHNAGSRTSSTTARSTAARSYPTEILKDGHLNIRRPGHE
jgi:hypothetical protein